MDLTVPFVFKIYGKLLTILRHTSLTDDSVDNELASKLFVSTPNAYLHNYLLSD